MPPPSALNIQCMGMYHSFGPCGPSYGIRCTGSSAAHSQLLRTTNGCHALTNSKLNTIKKHLRHAPSNTGGGVKSFQPEKPSGPSHVKHPPPQKSWLIRSSACTCTSEAAKTECSAVVALVALSTENAERNASGPLPLANACHWRRWGAVAPKRAATSLSPTRP